MNESLNNAVIEVVIGGSININKTDELRRVIAFVISDDIIKIPIGFDMVLNYIKARNVSRMMIKEDNAISEWEEVDVNTEINRMVSGDFDLLVKVERTLTDPDASVVIKATEILM